MKDSNTLNIQTKTKKIGTFTTVMMALVSLVGFGWLFGVFHSFKMAGPAAILSWIIGGLAVLLIALTIIELGTTFPKMGGIVHYLNISHGPLTGFIGAIVNWLVMSSIVMLEACASVQCLATWNYPLTRNLYNIETGLLTISGLILASVLILVYFILNYWALKVFVYLINVVGILKLIIPISIAVILILAGFSFHSHAPIRADFMPHGWSSVFKAVPLCGIFFCYYGFHSILSFSDEMEEPTESIPMAIIGSIIFCIVLYVLLQIAFVTAVPPEMLKENWYGLDFLNSPYAKLAIAMNLNFAILLLNVETIVSPNGSGLISAASGFRMLSGMEMNGQMPAAMSEKHPKYQVPRKALAVNLLVCLIFLALTRSWKNLVEAVTVACIISYIPGPIAAGALRSVAPKLKRPVKIPLMKFICPFAFVVCTLALYWAKWNLLLYVFIFILISLLIFVLVKYKGCYKSLAYPLKSCCWFLLYIPAVIVISYFGSEEFGGNGFIPAGYDQLLVCLLGLIFYYWAIKSSSYKKS